MTNDELVIDVASSEISIAILEDKRLVEFSKEKTNTQYSVGDIYLGKVKKIMPALNAAFIDIGYEKDAFIHYLDLGTHFGTLMNYADDAASGKQKTNGFAAIRKTENLKKDGKIQDVLKIGQYIVVQIVKEAISTKGPRLTSEISLAGRNMVLMPFADKILVSQKIEETDERKRLRKLVESILPPNYGVIIRTAAEGKRVAMLDNELRTLIKRWETCCAGMKNTAKVPRLLAGEIDRTIAILRDVLNVSFNNIYVNEKGVYNEIKEFLRTTIPEKENILKLYEGNVPIFEQFGISKQIKSTFGRIVPLKKGIYLVVERTEALHVIDVNSGARGRNDNDQETNAIEVNIAAAEEIAHQMRLRDLGGIVIIDFIDMYDQSHKQQLYEKMCALMEKDRAKHNVLPLTKFGLMQITRQRVRPEIRINTAEICPACGGTGRIQPSILLEDQIENMLAYYKEEKKFTSVTLKTHPYIASFLKKGFPSRLLKWKIKYKCGIKLQPDPSFSYLEFHFFDKNDEKIDF